MIGIVFATLSGVEKLIKNPPFYGNEYFDEISARN